MRKDGGEAGGVGGRGSGERGVSEASNKPNPNKRRSKETRQSFPIARHLQPSARSQLTKWHRAMWDILGTRIGCACASAAWSLAQYAGAPGLAPFR